MVESQGFGSFVYLSLLTFCKLSWAFSARIRKDMMVKRALRVAFGFFNAVGAGADAEVHIEDHPGVDSARPIGVVPFVVGRPGAAPEDVSGIVAADLRNSGKFNPLDHSRPLQPTSAQEVQPAWSALGIDAVVVSQVAKSDGSYQVAYQLVDFGGRQAQRWRKVLLKSLNSTCAMRRTRPASDLRS